MRISLVVFAGALAMGLASASAASAAAAAAPDRARLREVFVRNGCWSCHGYEGQGGSTGPKISPPPAFPAFSTFVRTTTGAMPPFTTAILSDQDLRDIHAYLSATPPAPAVASIPILQ